jgi:hypothetical protein
LIKTGKDKNSHLEKTECLADLKSKKDLDRKFKASKDYLGRPSIVIVANNSRLDLEKYLDEGDVIVNESILTQR